MFARLDRLGTKAKEIAQIGAVIGREFGYELLAAVTDKAERDLIEALDLLVGSGLVFCKGSPPDATYTFKHALVQEAARASLLRKNSQLLHGQIAVALEQRLPAIADSEPELLALHWTQANNMAKAVAYWKQAGIRAAGNSADVEAIDHLEKAISLLVKLPDSPARVVDELALQSTLGATYMSYRGLTAPEVARAYAGPTN